MNTEWVEVVKAAGVLIGLITAVIGLIRVLRSDAPPKLQDTPRPPSRIWNYVQQVTQRLATTLRLPQSPYSLTHEVFPIVATGVTVNYLCLTVAVAIPSILYLDMTGTAFIAFLLGPWWGVVGAIISSTLFNPLFYPRPDYEVAPWVIVNIVGALFWGCVGQSRYFKTLLFPFTPTASQYIRFFLVCGVCGAFVMAVPGAVVAHVVDHRLALNVNIQAVLKESLAWLMQAITDNFSDTGPLAVASSRWSVEWMMTSLRYIPDKTVSCAIALMLIRYGFPIYEDELIKRDSQGCRAVGDSVSYCVALAVYIPALCYLLSGQRSAAWWPVWWSPVVLIATWMVIRIVLRPADSESISSAVAERVSRYRGAEEVLRGLPIGDFYSRVSMPVAWAMLTTLIFVLVLALPLIEPNAKAISFRRMFYEVVFNFGAICYGVLFVAFLARKAVAQSSVMVLNEVRSKVK